MPQKDPTPYETAPNHSSPEKIIGSLNELKEKRLWLEWIRVMAKAVKEKNLNSEDSKIKKDLLLGMNFLRRRGEWSPWLILLYHGIKCKILDPNDNSLRNDFRDSIKIMKEREPGLAKGTLNRYISKGLRLNIIDKPTLENMGYANIEDDPLGRFIEEVEYPND